MSSSKNEVVMVSAAGEVIKQNEEDVKKLKALYLQVPGEKGKKRPASSDLEDGPCIKKSATEKADTVFPAPGPSEVTTANEENEDYEMTDLAATVEAWSFDDDFDED